MMNNMFGGNTQQMIMNMLQQKAKDNPMMQSVLKMAQSNDSKGLEQFARNLCKERGVNVDDVVNNIKKQFGM